MQNLKIKDVHVHYSTAVSPEYLASFLSDAGIGSAVIQSVSHSECISLLPGALVMKQMFPGKFHVFASPLLSLYYTNPSDLGLQFVGWTERMRSCGCEGIKLLEGKPQMRKYTPVPDFDLDVWEPFWKYLEDEQIPVMWHVNDPESHWDPNVSDWVKSQGWYYDDSFINNEEQYRQVMNVIDRHSSLKVCFAHFFFMSAQLDRLDSVLDKYPGVMVDLTPGIEMYENFSARPDDTKAFFKKHSKRICFGTDIGGRCILTNEGRPFNESENRRRPLVVMEFLTGTEEKEIRSDGNFLIGRQPFIMRPLGLQGEILDDILYNNSVSLAGPVLPVNPEASLELTQYIETVLSLMKTKNPDFHPDFSVTAQALKYFRFQI